MSNRRHERVSELFLKVCDMEPQKRRAALDLECPGDAAMRDDVLALAEGDRRSAGFLEGSGVGSDFVGEAVEQLLDDIRLDQVAEHPATIGRYRILDVLGEGGMGTVYKAEQEHPRRTVALKMIRRGVTSPRILRRFEHEAQLLGRLQHPGIAQIYETGTVKAQRGCRPFFAMEFVDGLPVTEYAEQAQLTIRQRLELLARIGLAVHTPTRRASFIATSSPATSSWMRRGSRRSSISASHAPPSPTAPSPRCTRSPVSSSAPSPT